MNLNMFCNSVRTLLFFLVLSLSSLVDFSGAYALFEFDLDEESTEATNPPAAQPQQQAYWQTANQYQPAAQQQQQTYWQTPNQPAAYPQNSYGRGQPQQPQYYQQPSGSAYMHNTNSAQTRQQAQNQAPSTNYNYQPNAGYNSQAAKNEEPEASGANWLFPGTLNKDAQMENERNEIKVRESIQYNRRQAAEGKLDKAERELSSLRNRQEQIPKNTQYRSAPESPPSLRFPQHAALRMSQLDDRDRAWDNYRREEPTGVFDKTRGYFSSWVGSGVTLRLAPVLAKIPVVLTLIGFLG